MTEIEAWIENNTQEKIQSDHILLQDIICEDFNILIIQFFSKSRAGSLPTARYIYYYLANRYELFTTVSQIGDSIGREHSAASVGISIISARLKVDYNLRRIVKRIEDKLKKKL